MSSLQVMDADLMNVTLVCRDPDDVAVAAAAVADEPEQHVVGLRIVTAQW